VGSGPQGAKFHFFHEVMRKLVESGAKYPLLGKVEQNLSNMRSMSTEISL
jgi:hypothetical protein